MNVYLLDIAPLRGREREALTLLPEERREKALRIRREEARLRSIGASLLLRGLISATFHVPVWPEIPDEAPATPRHICLRQCAVVSLASASCLQSTTIAIRHKHLIATVTARRRSGT